MHDRAADVGPRWLHWWAILTVLVTLPLLLLGAEVTTKQVGMVDREWPTVPWHLFVEAWEPYGLGYLIEHGHRLAGYAVGVCAIVLVAGLWLSEPRRWLCWLGTAALLGVICQGLLGGFRVRLNALFGPDLAMIHGIFGQMVFATLVSVALCTSRRWADEDEVRHAPEDTAPFRRASLLVTALVLCQLALGAWLRHKNSSLALRGHLLIAFVVVAAVAWLVKTVYQEALAGARSRGAARLLAILVGVQLLLGVEALLVKLFMGPTPMTGPHWLLSRDLTRSLHVVVGSFVLAASVVVTLEAQRRTAWAGRCPATAARLEGAA